ncbi:Gti1/Pac2 family-domain-containing protein [Hypoxylon sp. NC1633]|nr:Gti1/Pac2 family-domain-containing protein [Hypoxylon sp. NC1633]
MSSGGILDRATGHSNSGSPLTPTFQGYIASTMDALVLFEACLSGRLCHVPRRPHDRERSTLIVSGNVFIYEEHSSGIKRWTDGVPWSPSRILGNFLLYRELDKPFQPGEKKRAMKRQKPEGSGVAKPTNGPRANSIGGYTNGGGLLTTGSSMSSFDSSNGRNETERALVGSLIDSYQFKQDGLVKKTISVTYRGVHHHMVSYYSIDDVMSQKLRTPTESASLSGIAPRASLISSGNFRAPVEEREYLIPDTRVGGFVAISQPYGDYINSAGSRSMSMPSMAHYPPSSWGHPSGTPGAPGAYIQSYSMAPILPPIPNTYAPPPTSQYPYDPSRMPSYGVTQRPTAGYPHPQATRRHSNMHATNGVDQVDYSGLSPLDRTPMNSAQLAGLGGHILPDPSHYSNGSMFGASAAASAAAAGATHPSNHHHSNSSHSNDVYGNEGPGHHSVDYEDQIKMDHSFDDGTAHQASTDFGTSLAEHPTHGFATSGEETPPTAMHLGLEDPDSASNGLGSAEWATGFVGSEAFPQ